MPMMKISTMQVAGSSAATSSVHFTCKVGTRPIVRVHRPAAIRSTSFKYCLGGTLTLPKVQQHLNKSRAIWRQFVVRAADSNQEFSKATRLRSEAQAPFRTARTFIFGGLLAGATLGTLFGLVALVGAVGGAPNAKDLTTALKDLGIDLLGVAVCGAVLKRDEDTKRKQMLRISREETLGSLQVELASGKRVAMEELRSFARPIIVAGPKDQVDANVQAAEPYKKALMERGVVVVPVVLGGGDVAGVRGGEADDEGPAKWRLTPRGLGKWQDWMGVQMEAANVGGGASVYLSLRLDGRVRASGKGCPPWDIISMQLPKLDDKFFGGFGDGMDGFVGDQ